MCVDVVKNIKEIKKRKYLVVVGGRGAVCVDVVQNIKKIKKLKKYLVVVGGRGAVCVDVVHVILGDAARLEALLRVFVGGEDLL